MRTVANLLESAEKMDIDYLIQLSLINSQEEYVQIQQEQLSKGQRSDGKPIFNLKTGSQDYSPGYAKKKGRSRPIDLKDKGDFYGGIFIHVEGKQDAIVDSTDAKSGKLQDNYGEAILTLNEESKVKFVPVAEKNLIELAIQQLNRR